MNNAQLQKNNPQLYAPNAPYRYALTGSKGIIIVLGAIIALYIIGVIIGIYLGCGWGSILLPILIYNTLIGLGYAGIWIYDKISSLFRQ